MESLTEKPWDVVICGTGLQQSLLALALSRSDKRILHVDPNEYYGEHEAAFSLQETESWVAALTAIGEASAGSGSGGRNSSHLFQHASVWKHEDATALGLSFPRAYALALAPQIIHSRSKLLAQLVSSKAFRQVEFLAVGSFFVYENGDGDGDSAKLSRIPGSREDVFAAQAIPARSKRTLMKFLKFVVDYRAEEHAPVWEGRAQQPLAEFLAAEFKLDEALRKYILALTLALDDGKVTVEDGLAAIQRHLTSMGLFGPGFCAVYPKWGGLSEIAQVACRAGAVGGGIYMLGTGMQVEGDLVEGRVPVKLSNDVTVETSTIVSSRQEASPNGRAIDRLVAVINNPLRSLFETVVEGAPIPAVVVVAFPSGSVSTDEGASSTLDTPVYAFVHSSDTGECPNGQSVIYLTAQSPSQQALECALSSLLRAATSPGEEAPIALFKLRYVQSSPTEGDRETAGSTQDSSSEVPTFTFPPPSPSLAFDDGCLDAVKAAWKHVVKDEGLDDKYMIFEDREGVGDAGDDVYD